MWMSGVIRVEGDSEDVLHPRMGMIKGGGGAFRRAFVDFPPLAWFTRSISVPKCLTNTTVVTVSENGEVKHIDLPEDTSNALAFHRMSIGFRAADVGLIRWQDYYGYDTPEGRDLNESALSVGDDPTDWFVSESPIDILSSVEIRASKTIQNPKMDILPGYVADVHKMVAMCRANPQAFIPPSWITPEMMKHATRGLSVNLRSAADL